MSEDTEILTEIRDLLRLIAEPAIAEPRTRSHLQTKFGYKSPQALDHHLKPLREADLIREKVEANRTVVFEWSNLFRRLPKSTIASILSDTK